MAEAEEPQEAAPKKSKKPLIIGLVLALLLGGGGFYATWSGLILGPSADHAVEAETVGELPDIAFVPVEPLVITLGSGDAERHLRFTSQIEVGAAYAEEVTHLLPRIVDVLNSYLRAVEAESLQDPAALVRMRAHLLRRIQIVTGEGRVRDLLVTEFVLNQGRMMELIADVLMSAGAFGAAIYCYVLAGRLKKFSTLESGMGGAIAVLSAQVDDMTRALDKARGAANGSASSLEGMTTRAETVCARLELLVAAMHDLPEPQERAEAEPEGDRKLRFVRRRAARGDLEAAE